MIQAGPNRVLAGSVLVLNRHYAAMHVVTVRRAFVMLFRDTAEVIDSEAGSFANYDFPSWCAVSELRSEEASPEDDWLRRVDIPILVPRVIRVKRFDRLPRPALRFNRRSLFARDGHQCQYCGSQFPNNQLSLDHVVPRSRGGKTSWENVVAACQPCN